MQKYIVLALAVSVVVLPVSSANADADTVPFIAVDAVSQLKIDPFVNIAATSAFAGDPSTLFKQEDGPITSVGQIPASSHSSASNPNNGQFAEAFSNVQTNPIFDAAGNLVDVMSQFIDSSASVSNPDLPGGAATYGAAGYDIMATAEKGTDSTGVTTNSTFSTIAGDYVQNPSGRKGGDVVVTQSGSIGNPTSPSSKQPFFISRLNVDLNTINIALMPDAFPADLQREIFISAFDVTNNFSPVQGVTFTNPGDLLTQGDFGAVFDSICTHDVEHNFFNCDRTLLDSAIQNLLKTKKYHFSRSLRPGEQIVLIAEDSFVDVTGGVSADSVLNSIPRNDQLFFKPVPEPSALLLLASGLAGLIGWRSRRIQK